MISRKKIGVSLALVLLLLLVASSASADTPTKERQFVYGLNLWDGASFAPSFIPKYVDTLYIIADAQNTIDPKQTDVYWWPLTNEYKGDFGTTDQVVTGTLEIRQGGRLVATQQLTPYVIQFDNAGQMGNGKLFVGPAAQEHMTIFEQERQAYLKREQEYADASTAYTAQVDDLTKRANDGEKVTIPPAPQEPAPFTLYSTDVVPGFDVQLPAGDYTIQVLDPSGKVVPDSQKHLVAITPRRASVGYQVVSQEKWTRPDTADDLSNAIYTIPGGVVYLKPFTEQELNALGYARIQDPQDRQATANNWTWVHLASLQGVTLVVRNGATREQVPLGQFSVLQTPGAALGYNIVPFVHHAGDPPPGVNGAPNIDLEAFRIAAPESQATLDVALVDASGHEIPGSARQIIVNPSRQIWQLALPVLVPLFVGLTVVLWRREQVVTRRSLPPEKRLLVT